MGSDFKSTNIYLHNHFKHINTSHVLVIQFFKWPTIKRIHSIFKLVKTPKVIKFMNDLEQMYLLISQSL